MIEPIAELALSEKWRARLDSAWSRAKRRLFLVVLTAAFLVFACFQAFDDMSNRLRHAEHDRDEAAGKLKTAENRPAPASTAISRLEITKVWPKDFGTSDADRTYGFTVDYANSGPISAEEPEISIRVRYGDGPYSVKDEDVLMEAVRSDSFVRRDYEKYGRNQLPPSRNYQLIFRLANPITPAQYVKNQLPDTDMIMAIRLEYGDEATLPGYNRVTEFCGHLRQSGVGGWIPCHSYNRVFLSPR